MNKMSKIFLVLLAAFSSGAFIVFTLLLLLGILTLGWGDGGDYTTTLKILSPIIFSLIASLVSFYFLFKNHPKKSN